MDQKILQQICKLVGPITEHQLRYVECAACENIGLFIPSIGQCGYAIIPKHTHPAYSLIIALESDSPVSPKNFKPGSDQYGCTAMSPGIPHQEEHSEVFVRFVAVQIQKDFFEKIWKSYTTQPCGPFIWAPFAVSQSIMSHINEFFAEFNAHQSGSAEILRALGICITHALIRAMLHRSVSVESSSQRLEIQSAIQIMHAHFGEKLSVSQLANKVNCSDSHFSRLFKQETGISPAEYLIKIRIDKAKKFLSTTSKSATEIALECGFASTAHFSGSFRKLVGMNPLQYRKNVSR